MDRMSKPTGMTMFQEKEVRGPNHSPRHCSWRPISSRTMSWPLYGFPRTKSSAKICYGVREEEEVRLG